MKKYTTIILAVVALVSVQTAFAASSDYLLKLEGVDGESTKAPATMEPARLAPPPAPPRPAPTPSGDPDFDLLKTAPPSPTSPVYQEGGMGGVNPMHEDKSIAPPATTGGKVNIAVGDVDGDGHDDVTETSVVSPRKMENSEKREGVEPRDADFRDEDADDDGVPTLDEDLNFSEPSEAQAIYMKLGDIKGEASEGKEVRKNISINLRAKELRGADEKTRAEILALAPTSTEAVRSGDDLALFMLRDAMENPAIEAVDLDTTKMVIHHEAQGKFLGLFKMSYKESIEVGREGDVKVHLPWYSILVNEDLDEDEIALVAKEKKKEKPAQIESWSFGASQAGMYKSISDKLKASYDLKMNKKA